MNAPIEWIDDELQVLGAIGLGAPLLQDLKIGEKYIFSIRFSRNCSVVRESGARSEVKDFGFGDVKSWTPPYDILTSGKSAPTWLKIFPVESNSDSASCVIWFKGKWKGATTPVVEGFGTDGVVQSVWTELGQRLYNAEASAPLSPVPSGGGPLPPGSSSLPYTPPPAALSPTGPTLPYTPPPAALSPTGPTLPYTPPPPGVVSPPPGPGQPPPGPGQPPPGPGQPPQIPPALEDLFQDAKRRCPARSADVDRLRNLYLLHAASNPTTAFDTATTALEQLCPSGAQQAEAQLGFPIPDMTGIPANIVLRAIEAAQKVVAECPALAGPNAPVAHALGAFSVFGTAAAAAGVPLQPHLDALFEALDQMCPTWRGAQPGVPNPTPPTPPATRDPVAAILGSVVEFLNQGNLDGLADVAQQAIDAGLPRLGQVVQQYVDRAAQVSPDDGVPGPGPGPATVPGPGPQPPDGGAAPVTTTKKSSSAGLVVGLLVVGVVGVIVLKSL